MLVPSCSSIVRTSHSTWTGWPSSDSAFKTAFPLRDNVQYNILGNDDTRIYVLTNANAPHWRVAWFDLTDTATEPALHDIVPEGTDKIDSVVLVRDKLYVEALHDATSFVRVVDLRGNDPGFALQEFELTVAELFALRPVLLNPQKPQLFLQEPVLGFNARLLRVQTQPFPLHCAS